MAKTKCFYNGVSEHDMDLMFLQLFSTDIDFVRLFLVGTPFNTKSIAVNSVELSKTDSRLGESDITVNLLTGKKSISLLIEDKIDAIAMPEQHDRYIKRGKKGVKDGEYKDFGIFIICPKKYYEHNDEAKNRDSSSTPSGCSNVRSSPSFSIFTLTFSSVKIISLQWYFLWATNSRILR